MRVLLDTHVFLWLGLESKKISANALQAMAQAPERYLSIASVWEMQIKSALKKLPADVPIQTLVEDVCLVNDIHILPITQVHIYRLADLPKHHGDPFDRMLVVQAQHEGLTLVTADGNIPSYDVETAW